jgi:hypothetical protein
MVYSWPPRTKRATGLIRQRRTTRRARADPSSQRASGGDTRLYNRARRRPARLPSSTSSRHERNTRTSSDSGPQAAVAMKHPVLNQKVAVME